MTVKELIDKLQHIAAEIGGDGEFLGSHKNCKSQVQVLIKDPENNDDYELIDVEPDFRIGCGCWQGAYLILKEIK